MPVAPPYYRSPSRRMPAVVVSAPSHLQNTSSLRRFLPLHIAAAAFLLTLFPDYFWGRHLEEARRFAAWKEQWSDDGMRRDSAGQALLARISPISPAEPERIHLNERQVGELLTEHFECD